MDEVQIFVEDNGSDTIGRFILEAKALIEKHLHDKSDRDFTCNKRLVATSLRNHVKDLRHSVAWSNDTVYIDTLREIAYISLLAIINNE